MADYGKAGGHRADRETAILCTTQGLVIFPYNFKEVELATAKLRRVGGSVMLAIPPALLDELHLAADSSVELSTEAGKLVVRPARRRYTLDELLSQCDPDAPLTAAEREWVDTPAVGDEIVP